MPSPEQQEHQPKQGTKPAGQPPWDAAAIARALMAPAAERRDVAYGLGTAVTLGSAPGEMTLELYPSAGVARLTSQDVQLAIHRVELPRVDEDAVVFRSQQDGAMLSLDRVGTVILFIAPPPAKPETGENARESSPEPSVAAPGPSLPPTEEAAPGAHPGGRQRPSQTASSTAPGERRERPGRIRLTGTVGRDPTFKTSDKGAYLRFPLAVQSEDKDTMTWHNVYTTKQFAERYKDQVHKGQQVEVIGSIQEQNRPQRDGTIRVTTYVYAYAVKPLPGPKRTNLPDGTEGDH